MKTKGKSKKAFAAFLLSCVLMMAIAPNVNASPKWWQSLMKTLGFDTGYPCWSAFHDDGSHHFRLCGGSCPLVDGIAEGSEGSCPN